MTISWVKAALDSTPQQLQQYLIIELMLERVYLFPMAVRLSNGSDYIAWQIPCLNRINLMMKIKFVSMIQQHMNQRRKLSKNIIRW